MKKRHLESFSISFLLEDKLISHQSLTLNDKITNLTWLTPLIPRTYTT